VEKLLGGARISTVAEELGVTSQSLRKQTSHLLDPGVVTTTAKQLGKNIDLYL